MLDPGGMEIFEALLGRRPRPKTSKKPLQVGVGAEIAALWPGAAPRRGWEQVFPKGFGLPKHVWGKKKASK